MSEQEQQGLTYTPLLRGVYARTKKRDGSEAEPAVAFAQHPGTGLYRAGANDLGVSVDGQRVVRVDGNGMHVEGTVVVRDVVGPNGETFVTDLEHIRTDFVPSADDAYTLGNATHGWAHVHAAELDTYTLSVSGDLAFDHVAANVEGLIEGGLIGGGIDLSNVRTDMKPATHATYDVGASGRLWNTAWVDSVVAPAGGLDVIVDDAVVGHVDETTLTVTGNVNANILVDGVPLEDVPLDLGAVASDVVPAVDGTYDLGARDPDKRWTDLHAAAIAGNVAFAVDDQTVLAVEQSNVLVYGDMVVDAVTGTDGVPLAATYDWENAANLIPRDDGTIDLGAADRPWATVYSTTFDVGDGASGSVLTGNAAGTDGTVLSMGHVTAPALRTAQRGLARPLVLSTLTPADPDAVVVSGVPTQVAMTGENFGPGMVLFVGNAMCETFLTSSDGTEAVVTVEADEDGLLECTLVRGDTETATGELFVNVSLVWVTDPQLPPITKGFYYETTVVATAGSHIVTYASDDLPTGLSIDEATGVISGVVDVEVVPELRWTVTATTGATRASSIEREFVAAYEATSVSIGGMAVGSIHSLVSTATGLFTFGYGTPLQLLDDRTADRNWKPEDVVAAIGDETVVAVGGGLLHTIVLTAEGGGIWTGGENYYGQLGHSENVGTYNGTAPRDILNEGALAGRNIVSVIAAQKGCFAVDDAGTVISWGWNYSGNLARPDNFGGHQSNSVPTATSVTSVVKLSSDNHTVALTVDKRVLAWGQNYHGQLGNGGTADQWQPQDVTASGSLSGRTVVDVAAGGQHTVVICSDGTVHGAGYNFAGSLSDAGPDGPIRVFAQLTFPTNAVSVVCGYHTTYVIDDAGDLWGCGINGSGQLGIPGGDRNVFTKISGTGNPQGSLFGRSDVNAVAAMVYPNHALVQCADGSVHAFGRNDLGQCGVDNGYQGVYDPVDITAQFGPPPVEWTTDALPVARNGVAYSAQFEATAGGVACTKFLTTSAMPPGLTLSEGGELAGTPSSAIVNAYDIVVTAVGPAGQAATKAFDVQYNWSAGGSLWTGGGGPSGNMTSTALDSYGALWAWGDNRNQTCAHGNLVDKTAVQNVMTEFPAGVRLVTESGGYFAKMALSDDGRVFAWGYNNHGTAGLPANNPVKSGPNEVNAGALVGKTVTDVFLSYLSAFALTTEKSLVCWGYGGDGQIGALDLNSTHVPSAFPHLGGTVEKVMGGGRTLFALDTSGRLWAWGLGHLGQMGNGTNERNNPTPHEITSAGSLNGKTASTVESSTDHVVAMMTDGSVHQWGRINSAKVTTPQAVVIPGDRTAVDVAAGSNNSSGEHSAALMSDGTLWTWGENDKGQLGNGTRTANWTPMDISGLGSLAGKKVIELAKGLGHTVALCDDGTLHGWGDNTWGQLIFPVVSTVYLEPVELQAIPGMGPPSITWTTDAALPDASEGEAYSVTLEATPGVVEYEITSGALPSWASLDAATGEISGTPDAIVRSHAFGVTAYSTAAPPSTNAFELNVN